MIIIGELINTSRKRIARALEERDEGYIRKMAKKQADSGAHYIDVNCGTRLEKEVEDLPWLVEVVQSAVDLPLCIDSPRPEAIEAALKVNRNGTPIINSVTGERDRAEAILPLVKDYGCRIIALTMDESGVPRDADSRVAIAEKLAGLMDEYGIPLEDVFFDPLVQPVSSDSSQGVAFLEAVGRIKERYPQAHVICGLSNISYGLPNRKLINRTFLAMAMLRGLDSAILDPTDQHLMATLCATRVLLGQDEFCMEYITASREGRLEV
jgi:5-methyltetrahydrofolate--homocysteine methyltransferase